MAEESLLTAKIRHGFDHLDADGDGRLTEEDHVIMGRRVAAALGHPPGSEAEAQIIAAYVGIWRDLHLPHTADGAAGISKEEFVRSTSRLASDPQAAQATVGAVGQAYLAIVDAERDGHVTPDEFPAFQRGHFPALTQSEADEAFAHLDSNGDGYLSEQEFTQAIVEYWSSQDPDAPGNWWMGRPPYQR